ncbi:MAG: hypothetical protein AAB393_03815, partial [Bacteroidota bacterium]
MLSHKLPDVLFLTRATALASSDSFFDISNRTYPVMHHIIQSILKGVSAMTNSTISVASRLLLAFAFLAALACLSDRRANAQIDNPNVDNTVGLVPPHAGPRPGLNSINVITTPDGYDNFDIGVDFAEPHMSTNPRNPLWWFNAFNTNGTHHTENGHDWATHNPPFPSTAGDPATAYDSLGNLYY